MIVNKDSWHYKLACYFAVMKAAADDGSLWALEYKKEHNLTYRDLVERKYVELPTNFCHYWRFVLITGPGKIFWNVTILLVLIGLFIKFTPEAAWAVAYILMGVAILTILAAAVFGASKTYRAIAEKAHDSSSFVGAAYNAYKNNVCTLMQYEALKDKDEE